MKSQRKLIDTSVVSAPRDVDLALGGLSRSNARADGGTVAVFGSVPESSWLGISFLGLLSAWTVGFFVLTLWSRGFGVGLMMIGVGVMLGGMLGNDYRTGQRILPPRLLILLLFGSIGLAITAFIAALER